MNNQIFFFLYNLAHQSKIFDDIVIFFAVYFPYIVIILAGLFLLFNHEVFKAENPFQVFLQKKKEILMVFFIGIIAYLADTIIKIIIHTQRPFDLFPQIRPLFSESWYSFPSGHATFFMALAFSLFFLHKKAGYIFMFFALLIGIARIIAGVHFPIDILGGFCLGFLVAYLFNKFEYKRI
jgi:membrane-associated phospholipid phosphatase